MSDEQISHSDATFEGQFRGSPAEVRRRLSVYLPLLEEAGLRELEHPLLDLGFGRGEWLEMLAEQGYRAVGVDTSEDAVALARRAGLEVARADVFEDLLRRRDGSASGVTAFHVVEHLDPRRLAELLREIHRVLTPGGVVVLETPNPENVVVSTLTFHLDSEHMAPVPPALLEFHARSAGFASVWIARMNRQVLDADLPELPDEAPGALEMNAMVYALNGLLFAAPDYALVAVKASDTKAVLDDSAFERLFGVQPLGLAEHRRLAAEETARRLQAENLELVQRSDRLEREAAEARARAIEAQARTSEAEARASEGQARAFEAEARAQTAWADIETVSDSLSWRLTRPLRTFSSAVRGAQGWADSSNGNPKHYAKLLVGYPMRWALSQPRIGPTLDRQLVKVPFLEHKVRIAVHEVTIARFERDVSAADDLPSDLAALSEPARSVFVDLERAFKDAPS